MGTRASIVIQDKWGDIVHLYRGHDGYPSATLTDLKKCITEFGSYFSDAYDAATWILWRQCQKGRTPDYELTPRCHGDEEYLYFIDVTELKIQVFTTPNVRDWEHLKLNQILELCHKIEGS